MDPDLIMHAPEPPEPPVPDIDPDPVPPDPGELPPDIPEPYRHPAGDPPEHRPQRYTPAGAELEPRHAFDRSKRRQGYDER